jgi:hypothetical protein
VSKNGQRILIELSGIASKLNISLGTPNSISFKITIDSVAKPI